MLHDATFPGHPAFPLHDRWPHRWKRAEARHQFQTCAWCGGRWYDGRDPSRSCGAREAERAAALAHPRWP